MNYKRENKIQNCLSIIAVTFAGNIISIKKIHDLKITIKKIALSNLFYNSHGFITACSIYFDLKILLSNHNLKYF